METMHRLSIADPREFFALPDAVLRRHLAHVHNSLEGRYDASAPVGDKKSQGSPAAVIQGFRRSRQELPTPGDVSAARDVLRGGADGSLAEAARATLRRAQVEE